jgi:predicted O-linked N-acetylglucosamine transferase (SPINDLY family)
MHRFDEARAHLARAALMGAPCEAIERHALTIDQACGIRLDAVLAAHDMKVGERRIVLPVLPHEDYLRVNRLCDLMLDSLYWSGGNTSLDALACGLPLVTLPGSFMRGRQSMAMLRLCGLDELVAADVADYLRIASRLGGDREWRTALRERLAQAVDAVFGRDDPIKSLEAFFVKATQGVGRKGV